MFERLGKPKVKFGAYELDLKKKILTRKGHRVSIRPQALNTLIYLVTNRDRVVPREELYGALWPSLNVAEDQSLNVLIQELRQILGDNPKNPAFIETFPRRGYRFVGQNGLDKVSRLVFSNKFRGHHRAVISAVVMAALVGALALIWEGWKGPMTINDIQATPRAQFIRGVNLVKEGKLEEGREALSAVVASEPGFSEGYFWLGRTYSWAPGVRVEDARKAKPFYDKALSLGFDSGDAMAEFGALLLIVDLDTRRAEDLGRKILEKDPKNVKGQLLMGWIRLAEGNPKGAIPYFNEVNILDPSLTNESGREGWVYYMAGEPEEAARVCRILVQAGFQTDAVRSCLMASYLAMGEEDLAISQAREMMKNAALDDTQIAEILGPDPGHWFDRFYRWRLEYMKSLDLDTAYGQALVDLALGDEDAAFGNLKHEVEVRHFPYFLTFNSDPRLAVLKRRPDAGQVFLTFSSMAKNQ